MALTQVTRWFPGCKLNILLQLCYPQQYVSLWLYLSERVFTLVSINYQSCQTYMQELNTQRHREINGETVVNISNAIIKRKHQTKWDHCGGFCLTCPFWNYQCIICSSISIFKVGLWDILSYLLYILIFHFMWKRSPAHLPERKIRCTEKRW